MTNVLSSPSSPPSSSSSPPSSSLRSYLERLCESLTVLPNLIPLTADRAVFRWWTAADYNEKDDDGHVRGGE